MSQSDHQTGYQSGLKGQYITPTSQAMAHGQFAGQQEAKRIADHKAAADALNKQAADRLKKQ